MNNRSKYIEHLTLWRGIVYPGHEFCQLISQGNHWLLHGIAIFLYQQNPCWLEYQIMCDSAWRTVSADVHGWLAKTEISVQIKVASNQHWWLNGIEIPEVEDCVDLDLNFSPSTNTIAIRRLNLAVGEMADITAAWLRFPSFTLEPLAQRYHRLEEESYRYESGNGQFVADLRVNQAGFVVDYPGIWQVESGD